MLMLMLVVLVVLVLLLRGSLSPGTNKSYRPARVCDAHFIRNWIMRNTTCAAHALLRPPYTVLPSRVVYIVYNDKLGSVVITVADGCLTNPTRLP